jgi:outer membrane protein assembly factor BamC
VNLPIKLVLVGAVLSLAACSALESDKVNYRSASKAKASTLDIPPDLSQLTKESRYVLADGSVSASSYQTAKSNATAKSADVAVGGSNLGDVRIERAGNQRWLVVKRPPAKLWEEVKEFWQDNGFVLAMDQADLGIMETDYAENRAKIPMDGIRSVLGRVLDSMYSTSERDKFRTRFEQNAEGSTEIYISHRGVQEIFNSEGKDTTVWQPRPADPELEAEFLRRLMVKLGVPQEQTKSAVAAQPTAKRLATATSQAGQPAVQIDENFERSWRRVGLALDRTGFTVEDRDRKQGIYFVRYVAPGLEPSNKGFFGKLFSSSEKSPEPKKYQIALRSVADVTTVLILNQNGEPENSAVAQRIVNVIADEIK